MTAVTLLVVACGQPSASPTPAPAQPPGSAAAPTPTQVQPPAGAVTPTPTTAQPSAPAITPTPTPADWRGALAAASPPAIGERISKYPGVILVPPDDGLLFAGVVVHTASSDVAVGFPPSYAIVLARSADVGGRPADQVPVYAMLQGIDVKGNPEATAFIDRSAVACGDYCEGRFGSEQFGGLDVRGQRAFVSHQPGREWYVTWKGPEEGQQFGFRLYAEGTRQVGAGDRSPENMSYARALTDLAERFVAVRMDEGPGR